MMIASKDLSHVLPTDRLMVNGMPVRELRDELRRIDGFRNALSVVWLWSMVLGLVVGAVVVGRWWGYVLAAICMVPLYIRFAILGHEAAHKLLFRNQRANDWVGKWVIAYPAWLPLSLYRRAHFLHHREEFGPNEPDIAFYSGYPTRWPILLRRLGRDAIGISGWKNLKMLMMGLRSKDFRPVAMGIIGVQALLWALSWTATGHWYIWPVLWFLPWMTGWRVVNRLRALGEHGGLGASKDRRQTTHNISQSLLARVWLVPYNTGWHLAHHVDMGIPWRNLPRLHTELVNAGYVTESMTYPSYFALWKALCSDQGPAMRSATIE